MSAKKISRLAFDVTIIMDVHTNKLKLIGPPNLKGVPLEVDGEQVMLDFDSDGVAIVKTRHSIVASDVFLISATEVNQDPDRGELN